MSKFAGAAFKWLLLGYGLGCIPAGAFSQTARDTAGALTLDQCVDYALKHQPVVNQAIIGEAIVRATNAINTSGWLPQASVSGNLTHYLSLPTNFIKNSSTGTVTQQKTGVINTFTPVLSVTQTIFNPSLLYAVKSASLYVRQAQQFTDSAKINVIAAVSKSFYSLLLTLAQIDVLKEDTARLNKNLQNAYHQYKGGIVDETDYDQAAISLNNSLSQLRQAVLNIEPQYALLKQVMGYPPAQQFNIVYDTVRMSSDIVIDTTQQLQYQQRIEFQELETSRLLQGQLVDYYRKAWLPTLGAFFDYDYAFQSNQFSSLFSQSYPYSFVGLSLSLPIFTGLARVQNIRRARLQYQLLDWQEAGLRNTIYAEYTSALANYRSNFYNLNITRENSDLAKKVYAIVQLQYEQGTVPYLNVITAESNLIQAEIGYQNALFQLLSSKIDLEKAMGIITVNH
jgi:outer membrane protein TolC